MTFQPAIISTGIGAWRMLQRTYDTQFEVFNRSPLLTRESDKFLEKIGSITTAEEFVKDRDVMKVALGAFGLSDDINNTYFIKKVMEDGTFDPASLANRLGDRRYAAMSEFFGFGPTELAQTADASKMAEVVERYKEMSFESAVGDQNNSLRVALYAQRELVKISSDDTSDRTKWFTIMGDPPLREMLETALNLPSSFAQLDLDTQLNQFRKRLRRLTGSDEVAQFTNDSKETKRLTDIYLAKSQVQSGFHGYSSASAALSLLQIGQNQTF
jgi:hypothetical protein